MHYNNPESRRAVSAVAGAMPLAVRAFCQQESQIVGRQQADLALRQSIASKGFGVMVSANAINIDPGLLDLRHRCPDLTAERKAFVGRLVRAGQIKLKPSLSENLVRVWIGSEIRDGNEELGRNVLEAIYALSFGAASGRAVLVVLDADNPSLELGRFSWLGGLEPI